MIKEWMIYELQMEGGSARKYRECEQVEERFGSAAGVQQSAAEISGGNEGEVYGINMG
jgi:hypothetical protein